MDLMLRFNNLCEDCKISFYIDFCATDYDMNYDDCIEDCKECWMIQNPILNKIIDINEIKEVLCDKCKKEMFG